MSWQVRRCAGTSSRHQCTVALATVLKLNRQGSCVALAPTAEETTLAEYAERRERFLHHLPPHSIVLLPAADEFTHSHDILSPHRQDSLWYHLFGLHTALRRQLDPPSSTLTEDVQATMALLARGEDNTTQTILCVPPKTVDRATMVWASNTAPLGFYETRLRAHAQTKEREGGIASTSVVITNDVTSICKTLYCLITQMATTQLTNWAEEKVFSEAAPATPAVEERIARDRGDVLRIMPKIFSAYPQQLRWDGRRYRLPQSSEQRQQQEMKISSKGLKESTPTFRHPLEAFFSTLESTAFTVQLPHLFFIDTAQRPWNSVSFHYKTAPAYTPGLVPSLQTSPTASPMKKQVFIDAFASRKRVSNASTSAARGEVGLPIRRVDGYAWSYRLLKSPSQVRQHLRSARATEHAFVALMRCSPTTTAEHDLHCTFQRSVCDGSEHFGASARVRSAYIPVIASGVRSTDVHYTDNCAVVDTATDVGVVRVDAGVEVENVPTDCARVFPIGAVKLQHPRLVQLYDGLVRIQRILLHRIAAGIASGDVARLHLDETRALLCSLGVDVRRETPTSSSEVARMPDDEEERECQLPMSTVRSCFCAHSYGHLFGLDVHEEWGTVVPASTPANGKLRAVPATSKTPSHVFKSGMMHTVEPGIYMPSLERAALFGLTSAQLPDAFHKGVGMQVEDDVLVLPLASDEGGAAQAAETTPFHCPWSRGTYLQHALAAFARYYCGGALGSDVKTLRSPLASPSVVVSLCETHMQALLNSGATTSRPPVHEWNVVCFLFSQRVAVDGYASAVAAIAHDIAAAHELTFVSGPAYASASLPVPDASRTSWYPYAVVVLTASVPKDRHWIEMLMENACVKHT